MVEICRKLLYFSKNIITATKDRLRLLYLLLTKAQRGATCKDCNTVILNFQPVQSPTEKFTTNKISDVSPAVLELDLPRKNYLPENTCDIASQCPHTLIVLDLGHFPPNPHQLFNQHHLSISPTPF